MAKILKINYCEECPYCYEQYEKNWCELSDEMIDDIGIMQAWCDLDDEETKDDDLPF